MSDKVKKITEKQSVSEVILDAKAYFGVYMSSEGEILSLTFFGESGELSSYDLIQAIGRLETMKVEMIDEYNRTLERVDLTPL